MTYILSGEREGDVAAAFARYDDYLRRHAHRFPASALALARSDGYFTPADRRCPHDAWLEALDVTEPAEGRRQQNRATSMRIRLLGADHDGHIELVYPRVYAYRFVVTDARDGHGDWRYDEFRLGEKDHVLHEIEWWGHGRWLIEADDVLHRWIPFDPDADPARDVQRR